MMIIIERSTKCEKCGIVKSNFEFVKFKNVKKRTTTCKKCIDDARNRVKEATRGG